MRTNLMTVDDYFSEERDFLSATPAEYFDAKRKCLRYHCTNIDAIYVGIPPIALYSRP